MANSLAYVGYSHSPSGSQSHVGKYALSFTGSYVNGTGETVNFLTASNTNGLELNGFVDMGTMPEGQPEVVSSNIGGYELQFSGYAAGVVNCKVFNGITELSSGAYPAALTGGSVTLAVPSRL